MKKKYIVSLSGGERGELQRVLRKLAGTSRKVRRAQILLKADANGPCWTDSKIADSCGCRSKTIENVQRSLVTEGFHTTLNGRKRSRPPTPKKLDGNQEARIIATRLDPAPKGFANWSLRLLAGQVVELGIVDSISHETVRQTLKKTA